MNENHKVPNKILTEGEIRDYLAIILYDTGTILEKIEKIEKYIDEEKKAWESFG